MQKEKFVTKTFRRKDLLAPGETEIRVTGTPEAIKDWERRRLARMATWSDEERARREEQAAKGPGGA
jgi:hypothetical protein